MKIDKIKLKKIIFYALSYRFFVFSITFSLSIYFLLAFGALAQYYISSFGLYSCEYCFTKVNGFAEIVSSRISIPFFIVSLLIFISSVLYGNRVRIYFTTLFSSALILTFYDYIFATPKSRTISYIIDNFMFNCFGAIFLSAFIIFNLASVQYVTNKKNVNLLFAALLPLASSFVVSFAIYGFLYLIYERSPTHIDAIFTDRIIGTIRSSKKEFGFLTDYKENSREMNINSLFENQLKWDSGSGRYDMQAFLFSGCIIKKENFESKKYKPTAEFKNVNTVNFETDKPVIYFAQGKDLSVRINNSVGIINDKGDKIISNIVKGSVDFTSMLHPFTLFINISPIEKNGLVKEIKYNLSVDGKSQVITNIIPPINISQRVKKLKCIPIESPNHIIGGTNTTYGLTSLALKFTPKGEVNFSKESQLRLEIKSGSFIQEKDLKQPLQYFSNGKINHINIIGLEELKIGGKNVNVSSSDFLYATGDNLTGYITNDNKIKIFGLANHLALNTKIMNLKPISMLNNKLSYLNASIFDILKIIFSMGVMIFISRYVLKFFKRPEKIEILKNTNN